MTTTSIAGYEFTAEQNATFMGLVRNLARSGVVAVVASAILLGYNASSTSTSRSGAPSRPRSITWTSRCGA